jgi:hypothetical protein
VQDLVGVIGNLGVTSGYLKVANHARLMLYIWQAWTMLALIGLIGVATLVAFPHIADGMLGIQTPIVQVNKENAKSDVAAPVKEGAKNEAAVSAQQHAGVAPDSAFYQGFITRLFLSITFGVFAAYTARQASLLREPEQKNRRRALELEALGPFIEPLDKETKVKFRVQIGERSFAVPDNDPPKPKDDEPVTAMALLKSKELV